MSAVPVRHRWTHALFVCGVIAGSNGTQITGQTISRPTGEKALKNYRTFILSWAAKAFNLLCLKTHA